MSSSTPDQPDPTRPDATSARPDDTVDATAEPTGASAAAEPTEGEPAGGEPAGGEPAEVREPDAEEPQDVTLLVDPARVRRAPRYPVFLWIGALVGVVAGLGFATWLLGVTGAGPSLMKPGVYIAVVVLATTALSMGVAGLIAVLADRRSLRRR